MRMEMNHEKSDRPEESNLITDNRLGKWLSPREESSLVQTNGPLVLCESSWLGGELPLE